MKYRKKPVIIEAKKYDGYNYPEIQDWITGTINIWPQWIHNYGPFEIDTLEGKMTVSVGDYIIKGVKGEFYPCKPDIFEQTYEPADAPTASPWHRVEEEPPDEKTNAIFYYEWTGISGTVSKETSIISLEKLMALWGRPIAWMEIPEPPKEDA